MKKPVYMLRSHKILLLVFASLIALITAEFVREEFVYSAADRRLVSGYDQIQEGMNKSQVRSLIGEPNSLGQSSDQEIWYFNSGYSQGILHKIVGLATVKGHYDLIVSFDDNGKVHRKYGGVN